MAYDFLFQKAIELQNSGALNEAERIYAQILQVMPENSDAWNLSGLVAQSKGNHLHAIDCFLSAIKYSPKPFAPHYFNLSLSYKALEKKAEAEEALLKAVSLAPDFKEGWNYLGNLQAENGHTSDAIKSFCKALDIDGNYEEARVNLCFYSNDKDALFALADENKNDFWAAFRSAELCEDTTQKEVFLRRAVQIAPERTDALLALADFLMANKNLNESLTFYHKVLNLDDKEIRAWLGAADIYLAQDNLDKAEQYYLKSFDIRRDIAGAYFNYATVLHRKNRLNEALDAYRTANTLANDMPEISYNLALILKDLGDFEEALGLLFNAHLKAPDNDIFAIAIAETLSQLYQNNAELALKIAENWQKQEPENLFSQRVFAGICGSKDNVDSTLYSEKLFDAFAPFYDETYSRLNPNIINEFKNLYGNIEGTILDLGCGTGLAGVALKNNNNVFDGVDISANMLEKAAEKKVYRQLYQQDILSFLQENAPARRYNLVISFDVFCYMGSLKEILSALQGTEICFSIEAADEAICGDYYLTPNGRYKHKLSYINTLLQTIGFKEISYNNLVLREENGEAVQGFLFKVK